ncbi:MAG: TolC family protein, partial [Nitrospirota bacterium]
MRKRICPGNSCSDSLLFPDLLARRISGGIGESNWLFKGILGTVVAVLIFAGCTVHTPEIKADRPLPEKWHEPLDKVSISPDKEAVFAAQWWKGIADQEIDPLLKEILTANPDIARAKKRLLASQAAEKEVRSLLWPVIDLTLSFNRLRLSENSSTTSASLSPTSQPSTGRVSGVSGQTVNIFNAQARITYDLDLWGRNRHAVRSAEALTAAREAEVRSVTLLIIGETVRAYLDLLLSNEIVKMDREIVDMQKRFLQMTEAKQTAGLSTILELTEAKARLYDEETLLARAEKARALATHRIAF